MSENKGLGFLFFTDYYRQVTALQGNHRVPNDTHGGVGGWLFN
ncbi:hypothetical protein [Paenibacillus oryzisoli]|nr:hypothetical protein [Paenibacillus oryzisoli]